MAKCVVACVETPFRAINHNALRRLRFSSIIIRRAVLETKTGRLNATGSRRTHTRSHTKTSMCSVQKIIGISRNRYYLWLGVRHWRPSLICPHSCYAAVCSPPPECRPNAVRYGHNRITGFCCNRIRRRFVIYAAKTSARGRDDVYTRLTGIRIVCSDRMRHSGNKNHTYRIAINANQC